MPTGGSSSPASGHSAPLRLAIVGATASGKSSVAHALAVSRAGVELISVDAMQVYRTLDIGTAKPTQRERSEVRYHLVDLIGPHEEFTVARFQAELAMAVRDIDGRGGLAVAVGGTGLYHRSTIDRLDLPGEWPEIRAQLLQETDVPALHARLHSLDPEAAARMEPTNQRRIVRALEVCIGSGRKFSAFGPGLDTYAPTGVAQLGLRWQREVLTVRIERRIHEMIAAGWLDEVAAVFSAPISRTAAQALGYRPLAAHLRGETSLDEAIATTILETRQFAVRQERWFRRDPRIRWVDVESDPVDEALPAALELLDR